MVQPAAIERWLDARGQAYARRYSKGVWRMLTLELWFRAFIDSSRQAARG